MMMAIHMHVRICGCQTSVDSEYRLQFQGWINQLWEDKDALLEQMHLRVSRKVVGWLYRPLRGQASLLQD